MRLRGAAQPADAQDQGLRPGLGGSLAGRTLPGRATNTDVQGSPASSGGGLLSRVRRRPPAEEQAEPLVTRWSNGNRLATRVAGVLVAALLLTGPAYALYDRVFAPTETPVITQSTAADQRLLSRRLVASDVAAQWVQAWAGSSQAARGELASYYSGPTPVLPKVASAVSEVRVVDAQASGPGVWTVMVSAAVQDPGQDRAQRRYFQVPVKVNGQEPGQISAAPQAVPAIVTGPPGIPDAAGGDYGSTVSMASPAGQTISQFLAALLTGQGQVDRYVTPGSMLTALPKQAQYAAVDVITIRAAGNEAISWTEAPADGQTAEVLVDATVATSDKPNDQRSVAYPLQLKARDGRWEIATIQPRLADTSAPAGAQESTGGAPTDTEGATP